MRKIFNHIAIVTLVVLSITATSCLKDEGWENGEYGSVNGNTEGQEFVSIPTSARARNVLTVGVQSAPGVQPIKTFALSYDAADPAPSDFTVTLKVDNSLLTSGTPPRAPDAVILPSNAHSIQTLTLNFRAGRRISDSLIVNLNTDLLDPTKKYALGFTIESVSKAGVQIPSNLKNLVVVFTIKNKYDGVYEINAQMLHPADRSAAWTRTPFHYPYDIHVITTGPRTVVWNNTAFGAGFHPLMVPGVSGFGQTEVNMEFDTNDKLIAVWNGVTGGSLGRTFAINNGDPGTGSYTFIDPATNLPRTVTINNRYDPATKTIYAAFFMNQTGMLPIPIFDTLHYVKARP